VRIMMHTECNFPIYDSNSAFEIASSTQHLGNLKDFPRRENRAGRIFLRAEHRVSIRYESRLYLVVEGDQ
jgi:hypothetical protein